jgi:acyl-CoA thioesterase FadM
MSSPETARIKTEVQVMFFDTVERMRFWCAFEVRRPADNALIAQSRQMLAVIKMPPGKPVPTPEDWAVRFPEVWKGKRRAE